MDGFTTWMGSGHVDDEKMATQMAPPGRELACQMDTISLGGQRDRVEPSHWWEPATLHLELEGP
jgi:hypothetical protein